MGKFLVRKKRSLEWKNGVRYGHTGPERRGRTRRGVDDWTDLGTKDLGAWKETGPKKRAKTQSCRRLRRTLSLPLGVSETHRPGE